MNNFLDWYRYAGIDIFDSKNFELKLIEFILLYNNYLNLEQNKFNNLSRLKNDFCLYLNNLTNNLFQFKFLGIGSSKIVVQPVNLNYVLKFIKPNHILNVQAEVNLVKKYQDIICFYKIYDYSKIYKSLVCEKLDPFDEKLFYKKYKICSELAIELLFPLDTYKKGIYFFDQTLKRLCLNEKIFFGEMLYNQKIDWNILYNIWRISAIENLYDFRKPNIRIRNINKNKKIFIISDFSVNRKEG